MHLRGPLAKLLALGYHLYALPTVRRRIRVAVDWALAGARPDDVSLGLVPGSAALIINAEDDQNWSDPMSHPATQQPRRRGALTGTGATVPRTPPSGGWHPIVWGCEFLGTAVLLAGGLSAVFLDFGAHSPVTHLLPSMSARLLLTGLLFAGTGSLVALSPIGRTSGAHLNPAVTLAFFTQRKVHPHDVAGYIAAQLLGAVVACAVLRMVLGAHRPPAALGGNPTRRWIAQRAGDRAGSGDDRCTAVDDLLSHLPPADGAVDPAGQLDPGGHSGLAGSALHRD